MFLLCLYIVHWSGLVQRSLCQTRKNCQENVFFYLKRTFSFPEEVGLCPEPGGVLQARRSGAVFPYQEDDKILYTCEPCYPGGGTIACLRNGEWSTFSNCEQSRYKTELGKNIDLFSNKRRQKCKKNNAFWCRSSLFVTPLFSQNKDIEHCAVY